MAAEELIYDRVSMVGAILATAFAAVLISSVVAAGLYAWHLWRLWQERRKHTRERFLFTALGLLGRSFIAYVAFVFGGAWPFSLLISWGSTGAFAFRVTPAPPSEIGILGASALFACLTVFIWRVFKHWTGVQSEHERKYGQLPARELISVALLDRDRRRLMRHPARADDEIQASTAGWAIPGHLRALNLILAYDERYNLSEDQWHSEECAFIGRYGTENEPFIFFYAETLTGDFAEHVEKSIVRYTRHRKRIIVEEEDPDVSLIENLCINVVTFGQVMFDGNRLRQYERALSEELTIRRFGESSPSIQDMLVPLKADTKAGGRSIQDLGEYIIQWVKFGNHNEHVALLGEYGQGKSVFSIWVCTSLIRRIVEFKRMPILIRLGGKSPRNTSIEEMLDAWAGRYCINSHLVDCS